MGGVSEMVVPLSPGSTCEELLEVLGVDPETVIVLRGGVPIPLDETLENGEEVEVMKIVSGGKQEENS